MPKLTSQELFNSYRIITNLKHEQHNEMASSFIKVFTLNKYTKYFTFTWKDRNGKIEIHEYEREI